MSTQHRRVRRKLSKKYFLHDIGRSRSIGTYKPGRESPNCDAVILVSRSPGGPITIPQSVTNVKLFPESEQRDGSQLTGNCLQRHWRTLVRRCRGF